jgi:uncharacterized protein (TIGR02270 family)
MGITQPRIVNSAHAYRDLYEQFATEAAFLWLLRSVAVEQPHYTPADLTELESRIEAQLDGLMTAPELGWSAAEATLELEEAGEVFTAACVALRSHEVPRIQQAVEAGLANPAATRGLVSALGWLPAEVVRPWIEKFLAGKDMRHKYLGVAACSVRREDPAEALTNVLGREDCRGFTPLYARALRLVGELRRQDLMPAVQAARTVDDPATRFWANWSAILLGDRAAVVDLQAFVFNPNPNRNRALQLAFRVLPIEQARMWISNLAKDPAQARTVVQATGILGDPHAVNWLIGKMTEPALARLAGEAFSNITGIDLERHQLNSAAPSDQAPIPNDDSEDDYSGLDEDENLPWPAVDKVAALWRSHGQHFLVGRRYFLGRPITADLLKDKLDHGFQRQRHAAALELALLGEVPLPNTSAKNAS